MVYRDHAVRLRGEQNRAIKKVRQRSHVRRKARTTSARQLALTQGNAQMTAMNMIPKLDPPMLLLPKKRPVFVLDEGGGGLWICDAVGARDWRMEYVRCILDVCPVVSD